MTCKGRKRCVDYKLKNIFGDIIVHNDTRMQRQLNDR